MNSRPERQVSDSAAYVSTFPLRDRGRFFEDFEVGQRFEHHWGRTLTEADGVLYNSLTLNYNPLFGNSVYSQANGYRRAPLNPYLAFLTVLGLSVEDTSERDGGMFLGVEYVNFLAVSYPGDTVTAASEVVSLRDSGSRPTAGIVTWRTTGRNQHGELLVEFERTNLVIRRGTGDA